MSPSGREKFLTPKDKRTVSQIAPGLKKKKKKKEIREKCAFCKQTKQKSDL